MKLRKSHVAEYLYNAIDFYAQRGYLDEMKQRSEKQIAEDFSASLSPHVIRLRVSGQVFDIKISIPRDKG